MLHESLFSKKIHVARRSSYFKCVKPHRTNTETEEIPGELLLYFVNHIHCMSSISNHVDRVEAASDNLSKINFTIPVETRQSQLLANKMGRCTILIRF